MTKRLRSIPRPAQLLLATLLVTGTAGCVHQGPSGMAKTHYNGATAAAPQAPPTTFGSLTYRSVDRLIQGTQEPLRKTDPVIVTSVVDVDVLNRSSALGRMITEQISGRLAQLGYRVNEVKVRNTLSVEPEGELILSRDVQNLAQAQSAAAVITGTYAVGGRNIYVNLKTITPTGRVLNSVDYVFPADHDTLRLVPATERRS